MYFVLLRFSTNRDRAASLMQGHKAWIDQGIEEGVFVLVGSLKPNLGGALVAHGTPLADLQRRVDADPFVEHGVVTAEILEIAPSRADERLAFLMT